MRGSIDRPLRSAVLVLCAALLTLPVAALPPAGPVADPPANESWLGQTVDWLLGLLPDRGTDRGARSDGDPDLQIDGPIGSGIDPNGVRPEGGTPRSPGPQGRQL